MKRREFLTIPPAIAAGSLMAGNLLAGGNQATKSASGRISAPGRYEGFSDVVANGYHKVALYVPARDGTRLAVDIYRPTLDGEFFTKPLPTIFISTGYRRSFVLKEGEDLRDDYFPQYEYGDVVSFVTKGARLIDRHRAKWFAPVENMSKQEFRDWLLANGSSYEFTMMHGYNYAIVDNRSTGASFGDSNDLDHQTQGMDLSDLFEWTVQQDWSTDSIGMMGASWLGLAQNAAISCNAKHLKAVMPMVAGEDTFTPMYPGGLYNVGLMRQWYKLKDKHERGFEADVVDADPEGKLRAAAFKQREQLSDDPHWVLTIPTEEELEPLLDKYSQWSRDRYEENGRYYNRKLPDGTVGDWKMSHLDPSQANNADTAYYGYGGFWDLCAYTMAMAYADLTVPRKMVLGPWHHANCFPTAKEEGLRWMDYHLKGIDNGIMDEPPVVYATSHPTKPLQWFGATQFPPAGMTWQTLYASASEIDQPLRGKLAATQPSSGRESLTFTVNYETTSGIEYRQWGYFYDKYINTDNLEKTREQVLTFLSEPLTEDLEITGHPVLECSVAINAKQGGVFAFLHDVDANGLAYPVTDGQLDLNDRKVSEPPFNYLGLPYHSCREKDRLPVVPNEKMKVEMALYPTSWIVPAGHRLCLTITGADKDNFYQRELSPAPNMTVFCSQVDQLALRLPIMKPGQKNGAVLLKDAFTHIEETSVRAISPTKTNLV